MLTLNGTPVTGAEAEIRVDGTIIQSIDSINAKESLPGKWIYALGSSVPIARTQGEYGAEGDFSLLAQEMDSLRAALAAKHPRGSYGLVPFDILIQSNNGVDATSTIKLCSCRISGQEVALATGDSEQRVKVPLSVHWLELNGLRMVRPSEAFAGLLAA